MEAGSWCGDCTVGPASYHDSAGITLHDRTRGGCARPRARSVGAVTLVLASWRHLQRAADLKRTHPGVIHLLPILLTSALVIFLGVALTVVLLRLD